jgi:glycosyltransferase involved in cell wall biosynthesis
MLQRIPASAPAIAPIPEGTESRLWSVMIPVYNCSEYLTEAILSVLQQDPGPEVMQIEVVDDCSTDADIETLVWAIGKGRVSYFRQPKNAGSLRNFETCINRAVGDYIHLLHGDDRVKPGYYSRIAQLFTQYPAAGAAYSAWDNIDGGSSFTHPSRIEADQPCILENWLHKLAECPRIQYVAITVKRSVYEHLGSFYGVTYGEDWEMWARIAKHYPMAYTPEILAQYRQHKNSITWRSYQTGQNIRDIQKVTSTIVKYLPVKDQHGMIKRARKNYVYWILNDTYHAWHKEKNSRLAYRQMWEMIRIYKDPFVLIKMASLMTSLLIEPCRKYFKVLKINLY